MKDINIIFYDLSGPQSFDPLDADRSVNLYSMRMMYDTPLEFDELGALSSRVLSDYKYDRARHEITFILKPNIQYNNSNKIMTAGDIVLAIKRMALVRPNFPVINCIHGLQDWLKNKRPLTETLSGISIENQNIIIKLDRDFKNPLFRFALEIFSIVPSDEIDLNENKLKVAVPSSSGRFVLLSKESGRVIFQQAHAEQSHLPKKISFEYKTLDQVTDVDVNTGSVLHGLEYKLLTDGGLLAKTLDVKKMPLSMFLAIILNSKVKPFDKVECRRRFADSFRKEFSEVTKNLSIQYSSSILPPLLPGFFESKTEFSENNCKCEGEVVIPVIPNSNEYALAALKKLEKKISGLRISFKNMNSIMQVDKDFLDGNLAVRFMGSGFWPVDPVNDLKMLFTPGMHPVLTYVSENKVLRALFEKLDSDQNTNDSLEEINRYLQDDSEFNVYMHTRRVFASKPGLLKDLNQSGTVPYPWQIMNE